jgi:hypothetical protein
VELYEKIHGYHGKNVDVALIARHVGVSRRTVYRYLEMDEPPEPTQIHSTRKKLIEPYQAYLTSRAFDVQPIQLSGSTLSGRGGKVGR